MSFESFRSPSSFTGARSLSIDAMSTASGVSGSSRDSRLSNPEMERLVGEILVGAGEGLDEARSAEMAGVWEEVMQSRDGSSRYIIMEMTLRDMSDMLSWAKAIVMDPSTTPEEKAKLLAPPSLFVEAGEDVPVTSDFVDWETQCITFFWLLRMRVDSLMQRLETNREDLHELATVMESAMKCCICGIKKLSTILQSSNDLRTMARSAGLSTDDTSMEDAMEIERFVAERPDPKKHALPFVHQHMIKVIFQHGYRHIDKRVFHEIIKGGRRTYAWREVPGMETVELLVRRYTQINHSTVYNACLRAGNAIRTSTAQQLVEDEIMFPVLKTDPSVFSFGNAVYNIDTMETFVTSEGHNPPSNTMACNYIKANLDHEGVAKAMANPNVPLVEAIPTPELDDILEYQGYGDREVLEVVYALMGRMLHPCRKYDTWELLVYLWGVGGTGKSIIALIIRDFFRPDEVGIINSNQQKQFSMAGIADKRAIIGLEIGKFLNFDLQEIKSMLSGEPVKLAQKNKDDKNIEEPAAHNWWCSNHALGGDAMGDIFRRTFPIFFDKFVSESRKRGDKLKNIREREMANILVKCNIAYRRLAAKCGFRSLWEHVPAVFHHERSRMLRERNPIAAFLEEGDLEMYDSEKHGDPSEFRVSWNEFREELKTYCSTSGLKVPNLSNEAAFKLVFERFGLRRDGAYLTGCRFSQGIAEDVLANMVIDVNGKVTT